LIYIEHNVMLDWIMPQLDTILLIEQDSAKGYMELSAKKRCVVMDD